jgi:16S rRNA G966 N2-methylase RsmD
MKFETKYIPISLIDIIDERQRKDYGDLEPLKASIEKIGQINPISVALGNGRYFLLAGGRRLAAVTALGHESIYASIWTDLLDPSTASLIELEENIKRKQLDWKEEVLACTQLHDLHSAENPEWNVSNTADVLSLAGRTVSRYIGVGRALQAGNPTVLACNGIAAAAASITRQTQRTVDDEAAVLLDNVSVGESFDDSTNNRRDDTGPDPESDVSSSREFKSIRSAKSDVHLADFTSWAQDYSGPAFQVIHLDPPYGIFHHESEQGGGAVHGTYSDTEDDFWNILQALETNQEALVAPRAHIILWFSLKFYSQIFDFFSHSNWDDTAVNQFPLIWWKKDNIGLVPDAKRYGRRVYETALLISVGDRQINTVRPNLFAWESGKARAKHLSEKPEPVVNYFLSSLIEPERKVNFLDPCCGSGNALSAAERLGALSVTGLDIDPDSIATARRTLNARRLRSAGEREEADALLQEETDV